MRPILENWIIPNFNEPSTPIRRYNDPVEYGASLSRR